jgi:phosphohistidine swiveling domain-containing protein
MGNMPVVDGLERNPIEVIATGDTVEVDGDQGLVIVTPREPKPEIGTAGQGDKPCF